MTDEPHDFSPAALHERVARIRRRARDLLDGGATGVQVAAALSEGMDAFLVELYRRAVASLRDGIAAGKQLALVAVGGSGRGDCAPYSDVDVLFVHAPRTGEKYASAISQFVRNCWDAKLKLGQSVGAPAELVAVARQEPESATAYFEARLLAGSETVLADFRKRVRKAFRHRRGVMERCIESRRSERAQHGGSVHKLEPDVKRCWGGLRDVHLIRWIGYLCHGETDLENLRLHGALDRDDARKLRDAIEFLTKVRIDLHFAADKPNDVLSRSEQLRISAERQIEDSVGMRAVERFMQTVFQHTAAVADVTRRFVVRHQPTPWIERIVRFFLTHKSEDAYLVSPGSITVRPHDRAGAFASLEGILQFFRAAARYGVLPAEELNEPLKQAAAGVEGGVSRASARLFMEILEAANAGSLLRVMFETGVLDLIEPNVAHARCLLQFNQYHSYTVDEHTLRAVEAVQRFVTVDEGAVGEIAREVHHRNLLMLAVLLHDLGKGLEADHSEVGRVIADRTAERLFLSDHQRRVLTFLVYKHLRMSHLAFRRDISDPATLHEFAREVGSAETLRMLHVLTAADLMAVGPGVWNDWKASLLAELYHRTANILGGGRARLDLDVLRRDVEREMQHSNGSACPAALERLDELPRPYLAETAADRIAADLRLIDRLSTERLVVEQSRNNGQSDVYEYTIVAAAELSDGCFHRTTGALTARGLEIVAAHISTAGDGTVVDRYRVVDRDAAAVPAEQRTAEIKAAIEKALDRNSSLEHLFQRHMRFDDTAPTGPTSGLPPRVVLDNDSSQDFTVIDVFAHDRRGLLYSLTRAIYDLELSVVLAKIGTHLDQILDVFYVTDAGGKKIKSAERLTSIRKTLEETIAEFEREGYLRFAS